MPTAHDCAPTAHDCAPGGAPEPRLPAGRLQKPTAQPLAAQCGAYAPTGAVDIEMTAPNAALGLLCRISKGPAGCRINRDFARRGCATKTSDPKMGLRDPE